MVYAPYSTNTTVFKFFNSEIYEEEHITEPELRDGNTASWRVFSYEALACGTAEVIMLYLDAVLLLDLTYSDGSYDQERAIQESIIDTDK